MIEEGFVRLYAHDFTALAARAETGMDVEAQVLKRVGEAKSHAALMDARKGEGHLPAVVERLTHEAERQDARAIRTGEDIVGALARRKAFLLRVVKLLGASAAAPSMA